MNLKNMYANITNQPRGWNNVLNINNAQNYFIKLNNNTTAPTAPTAPTKPTKPTKPKKTIKKKQNKPNQIKNQVNPSIINNMAAKSEFSMAVEPAVVKSESSMVITSKSPDSPVVITAEPDSPVVIIPEITKSLIVKKENEPLK
jgi:hypothetical protein